MRKYLLLLFSLVVCGSVSAQGVLYQLSPPAPNARVLICPSPDNGYPCPTQQNIYSDSGLTQLIVQPVNLGSSGFFSFYVAAGTYVIQLTGPGYNSGNRQVVNIGGGSSSSGSAGSDLRGYISWSEDFIGQMPQGQNAAGTIAFGTAAFGGTAGVVGTSATVTATIAAGTTAFIEVCDSNAAFFFITDNSANVYTQISSVVLAPASTFCRLYATAPSSAIAATSVTVQQFGANENFTVMVYTATGVRSFGLTALNQATGTAVTSGNILSEDANNFIVTFISWYTAGANALTAGTGTARSNQAGTASVFGHAVMDNTAAGIGATLATSGTLAASGGWSALSVELRSTNGLGSNEGVGTTGWTISGPNNTTQILSGASGMVGVLQLQSGVPPVNSQFSTWAETYWPSNRQGLFAVNQSSFDVIFRVRIPPSHLTSTAVFCGLSDGNSVGESAFNKIGIAFNTTSDTQWTAVTTIMGSSNRVALGTAADNQPIDLRMRSTTSGTILYSLWRNGAILGSETSVTTQIPTAMLLPYCSVTPQTNSARFFDIDFSQGVVQVTR